jgi:hypothetical protein
MGKHCQGLQWAGPPPSGEEGGAPTLRVGVAQGQKNQRVSSLFFLAPACIFFASMILPQVHLRNIFVLLLQFKLLKKKESRNHSIHDSFHEALQKKHFLFFLPLKSWHQISWGTDCILSNIEMLPLPLQSVSLLHEIL